MNGRERVQAAIARKQPDRIPLGFYAVDHDTVERVLGRPTFVRNKVGMRLALAAGRRDEVAESLKKDTVEFYKKIDCADVILPKEACLLPPRDYEPEKLKQIDVNKWEDARGRVWQAQPEANDFWCIHDPTPPRQYTVEQFQRPRKVNPPDPSIFEAIDYVAEHLGQDRYVCSPVQFSPLVMLGDFDTAMLLYATDPEVIQAAAQRDTDAQNAVTAYYIRPGTAGALGEQDIAGTNGPFISPAMFRELCLPYMKARVAAIKQHTEQFIFHCCGRTIPLMDQFIEAGVDCYQSLQTTAGMDVGLLREQFGDQICFWGGVPVELLIDGTPEQVRQAVRSAIEAATRSGKPGGFILGPSHSVAMNTKYDNFMAMLDEYVAQRDRY